MQVYEDNEAGQQTTITRESPIPPEPANGNLTAVHDGIVSNDLQINVMPLEIETETETQGGARAKQPPSLSITVDTSVVERFLGESEDEWLPGSSEPIPNECGPATCPVTRDKYRARQGGPLQFHLPFQPIVLDPTESHSQVQSRSLKLAIRFCD